MYMVRESSSVQVKAIAEVLWPSHLSTTSGVDLTGSVMFIQRADQPGCTVQIRLVGLEPYSTNAIHIHEKSFRDDKQLEEGCMSLGGHFNPSGDKHGSIFNGQDTPRHAGDLCNNLHADENGHVNVSFYDHQISLNPRSKNYVGNRSVVIHSLSDDLGRQGRHIGHAGFIKYNQMTKTQFKLATGQTWSPTAVKKAMADSLTTGNAGGRMACGNIIVKQM